MTAATAAPPRHGGGPWLLLGVLVATLLLRLCCLDADPPASMPDPTIMDEGLWADAARGHVLFPDGPDWFADDLGNAYLIAPLYSWLLVGIYQLFGIGLWQTRLLAAIASTVAAAIAGAVVGRRAGPRWGALAAALCALCPLLDQHGRFAMIESTQGCWLLLSFALLFAEQRPVRTALLAGAAMGAAVLVKPNAVTFGVLPFAVAFLVDAAIDVRHRGRPALRSHLARASAAAAGGAAVIAAVALPVWLPHWEAFAATVEFESGNANWTLGHHLLRLGLIGSREATPGEHRLWALLRHAPLCTLGVWLLLLARVAGRQLPPGGRIGAALWLWLAIGLGAVELGYDHAARRQVLLVPAMAMLVALAAARRRRGAAVPAAAPWCGYRGWLLVLLPALLLAKPTAANALAGAFAGGDSALPGAAGLAAGLVVTGLAALLPAVPTLLRWSPTGVASGLLRAGPVVLATAAVFEVLQLGALPPHAWSIRDAQRQLAPLVEPGAVVLGQHAATLFQGETVRTVRRVLPGAQYSSPRPNADVATRLRPRYVLDYAAPNLREFADVTADGFEPIAQVGLLREPSGPYRFELVLWRRR